MGTLAIIVIGGMVLLFFSVIFALGAFLVMRLISILYTFLPFAVGIPIGLKIWFSGSKEVGYAVILISITLGIIWDVHFFRNRDTCRCIIHKVADSLSSVAR